jgi:hypothetical protein
MSVGKAAGLEAKYRKASPRTRIVVVASCEIGEIGDSWMSVRGAKDKGA